MLSDQPITSAKDDLLGRAPFARQVASAMLAAPSGKKGSFTIGLTGSWGSGKTSVLNMVVEALAKKRAGAPIVVQFNPWRYPQEELMAGQLLLTLAAELKQPERGKKLHKIAKAMEKYAAALQTCPPAPTPVTRERPLAKSKKKKAAPKRVSERMETVAKLLKKQKKKLYVIMDDIDRLSSARLCHALQLISAVAGFPRMVYLLAFDEDVVIAALDKELDKLGREYMKKFMQVQLAVPAADSGRLREILTAYVDTWLRSQSGQNFDRAYFAEISPFLFNCITSIRDVYRFINTFRVRYQALGNEVNFVDLLAITALQLHIPQALPWMQGHRDDLLRGGGLSLRGADLVQKKLVKAEHKRMLTRLYENDPQTLMELIGHMFPRYGKNVLDVAAEEADPRYVRMRRICCEEFFDLYFTQSTDGLVITQAEILKTIRDMDAAELRTYTDNLTTPERRNAYLNHLPYYLDDIGKDKLPMFFFEVLWLSRLPEGKTPTDQPFQRSFFQACSYCALRILAEMGEEMRLESLKKAVSRADKYAIPILITLLTRIRYRSPDADDAQVGEDNLRTYLRELLNKIHAISLDESWLTSHKPLPVLEYWKQADAVSFRVYFQKLMQSDSNAAWLISALTQRFDAGENMEYQYGDLDGLHAFSDDFPWEEAREAVLRLRGTEAFRALPEDVRLDCVAFSLMDEGQYRVGQKEVAEAYPAWMDE